MVDVRRWIKVAGDDVEILRVPWFIQSESDNLCYCFSLKMCLEYFKNIYPNRVIRKHTPNLDIDNIKEITNTKKGGTPRENLLGELNKNIPTLKFEDIENANFDTIGKLIERNIPVIVVYDCSFLKTQEKGCGHSGVVVGITDDKIILNNPWLGANHPLNKLEFERAWEIEYKRIIKITPIPQTQLGDLIGSLT